MIIHYEVMPQARPHFTMFFPFFHAPLQKNQIIIVMNNLKYRLIGALLMLLISLLQATPVQAQNDIGGHIGAVVPLLQMSRGNTTSIADNLVGGFPMGITLKLRPDVAFDLEVVPFLDENSVSNVIFHPGVLMGLTNGFTFGLRGAFETAGAYGVTPLLNKSFPFPSDPNTAFFVEFVLPIRFYQEKPEYQGAPVSVDKTISAAIHFGIGF